MASGLDLGNVRNIDLYSRVGVKETVSLDQFKKILEIILTEKVYEMSGVMGVI